MESLFNKNTINLIESRLSKLSNTSKPHWGKMNPSQMMAHLNKSFEVAHDLNSPDRPHTAVRLLLRLALKDKLTDSRPTKIGQKAPNKLIVNIPEDLETSKVLFIKNIREFNNSEEHFYDKKEHALLGKLTAKQWSNFFYKHINHHFTQFGI